jgi:FkbM family methyltransferase
VRTILDLGANIGVTVADLAALYPDARILGVELDGDNFELARQNTARWADRVAIVHGAVWTEDGHIAYGGDSGEHAYRVVPAMKSESSVIAEVPAFSMSTLIDRLAADGSVDYVKMDVEGAEAFLLAGGSAWGERVRCIKVEVHLPYDVASCSRELERMGFAVTPDPTGIPSVTGER